MNITIENLDIKPLEEHVGGLIGVQFSFSKKFIKNRHGDVNLHLESPELIGYSGIFHSVMGSVKVTTFNPISEYKKDGKGDFGGSISIQYETKNGGQNGVNLCDCFYSVETGKWNFR